MPWIPRDIIPGPDNPGGYQKGVEYFNRLYRKEPNWLLRGLVTAALISGVVIGYVLGS